MQSMHIISSFPKVLQAFRMTRSLGLLFSCSFLLLLHNVGCGPTVTPNTKCDSTLDCPGAQICVDSLCAYTSNETVQLDGVKYEPTNVEPKAEPKTEPKTEPQAEPSSKEPPEEQKEPITKETFVDSFDASEPVDAHEPISDAHEPISDLGTRESLCEKQPDGACVCASGETRECYDGPKGTVGIGICAKGQQECKNGKWEACQKQVLPIAEMCDGIDNDCDGQTDEDFPTKGAPCSVGKGACLRSGTQVCKTDKTSLKCSAVPGTVVTSEICDGRDNDCDGQTDEDFPEKGKSCNDARKKGECQKGVYTSCKNGLLICTSNTQPASKEICDNKKDDDCDGSIDENPPCSCRNGNTTSCYSGPPNTEKRGRCRRGKKTCINNQWGPCKGEVLPTKETCDRQDNDCNGKTDDNLTRSCATACGKGIEFCSAGRWVNCNAVRPRTELCNGKDDDCDGAIDEIFTNKGKTCYVGLGACRRSSRYICDILGKGTYCPVKAGPSITERCRDNIDNDCDGKIDEICGTRHPYAVISGLGTIVKSHLITRVTRTSAGRYAIVGSSGYDCSNRPMMIGPSTSTLRPSSFICSGNTYQVYLGSNNSSVLADRMFNVVLPYKSSDAATARTTSCPAVGLCKMAFGAYNISKIEHISKGSYLVTSPSCATTNRPVFAQIYSTIPGYITTGSNRRDSKQCYVRVYGFDGKPRDALFGIWMPGTKLLPWAITTGGNLSASNYFGDQRAKWSVSKSVVGSYTALFPSWANPSAVLVQTKGSSFLFRGVWVDAYPTFLTTSYAYTTGVRVRIQDLSKKAVNSDFQVVFVQ